MPVPDWLWDARRLYSEGATIRQIAAQLNIPKSSVHRWASEEQWRRGDELPPRPDPEPAVARPAVWVQPDRCSAHTKSGAPCRNRPIPGGTVCRFHGGATKAAKEKAQRRLDRQAAEKAVATYGLPVAVTPEVALLEEVHRTAGHVAWLGALIAELPHNEQASTEPPDDGDDDEETSWPRAVRSGLKQYTRDKGMIWEKPSVWVELYQSERAHLARVCKAAIDAGIAERHVRLAEQQASVIVKLLRGVLADLGVPDTVETNRVVARHLRAVS